MPHSDLIQQLTNNYGQLTTYAYDPRRDLKTQVLNKFGAIPISQFDYSHDALGRWVQRIDSAAVTNDFGYNNRSESTDAVMGTNALGYQYDSIGNREWTRRNAGTNRYIANELNQYLSVSSALSAASLSYDSDGNLTNDGVFTYAWDGENRMIAVEPLNPTSGAKKVVSDYDFMGRRVEKKVYTRQSDLWPLTADISFMYDGWDLVREGIVDSGKPRTNFYLWGLDLSRTLQGAGGVGGLLASINQQPSAINHFFYDANGNVIDLIDTNGEFVAQYVYDPYGNLDVQSGVLSTDNVFRFSSKYADAEVGLTYYGFRYYQSSLGLWVSRDPLGEAAFANPYTYVANSPLNSYDLLGLLTLVVDWPGVEKGDYGWQGDYPNDYGEAYSPSDESQYGYGLTPEQLENMLFETASSTSKRCTLIKEGPPFCSLDGRQKKMCFYECMNWAFKGDVCVASRRTFESEAMLSIFPCTRSYGTGDETSTFEPQEPIVVTSPRG